jgi:hypothetical protein
MLFSSLTAIALLLAPPAPSPAPTISDAAMKLLNDRLDAESSFEKVDWVRLPGCSFEVHLGAYPKAKDRGVTITVRPVDEDGELPMNGKLTLMRVPLEKKRKELVEGVMETVPYALVDVMSVEVAANVTTGKFVEATRHIKHYDYWLSLDTGKPCRLEGKNLEAFQDFAKKLK